MKKRILCFCALLLSLSGPGRRGPTTRSSRRSRLFPRFGSIPSGPKTLPNKWPGVAVDPG
jgi:hypothetical protein